MIYGPDHAVKPILAFTLLTRRHLDELDRAAREHVTRMNEEELALCHDVAETLCRLASTELAQRRRGGA